MWLTYKDKNKMYCSKCNSIGANNTMTAGSDNFKTSSLTIGMQLVQITKIQGSLPLELLRIAENRFRAEGPPYHGPLLLMMMMKAHHLQKLG
jgi:hypothetical protein